jgi:hypothetical protein
MKGHGTIDVDIRKSKVKGTKCDSIPTREKSKYERLKHRNMERKNVKPRLNLHFRVSDTGSWRCQGNSWKE